MAGGAGRAIRSIGSHSRARRAFASPPNLNWDALASIATTPLAPTDEDPIVEIADRFLIGGIALLGRELRPELQGWLTDPRTGFDWGDGLPTPGSDIKVPWEVSRFYFAPWLAGAAIRTGDSRYTNALADLVSSWVDTNPVGRTINWNVAMEAAIRSANLATALGILAAGRDLLGDEVLDQLSPVHGALLFSHGSWIRSRLETGPGPAGNHLLVGYAGLAFNGLAFSGEARADRWSAIARRGLEREADRQINTDGGHVEQSPYYHRLCMESIMAAGWAFRAIGQPSELLEEAACKMRPFVAAYSRPDGSAPGLADQDDGRFVVTSGMLDHERTHHSYLDWQLAQSCERTEPESVATFADTGYVFLRSGAVPTGGDEIDPIQSWASFRSGRFGGRGGHVHSDQLHVTWSHGRSNVLIDPGTGSYSGDPDERNELRSAFSHNAPVIDGCEPNPFDKDDIFFMRDTTLATLAAGESSRTGPATASGTHRGYRHLGVSIARKVLLESGLTVEDQLSGDGRHQALWAFCCEGEWEITGEVIAQGSLDEERYIVRWPSHVAGRVETRRRSTRYGETESCKFLVFEWDGKLPETFKFEFSPA